MWAKDREALICDMAETYHIYDVRALPVRTLATLACGLRDDSRIKLAMMGWHYVPPFSALVEIHDILAQVFHNPKTGGKPRMLADVVIGKAENTQKCKGFATPEEFERAWARFIKKE